MLFGEQVIEPETGYRSGTCLECSVRDRDFSGKKLYKCELCGRWFCAKHVRPRTFLIRGVDGLQDEQIPEGLGLYDVPIEPTPEQVTLMLGASVGWIKERASEIKDRVKSRKEEQNKWKHEDSHPDFQYTQKWLEELDVEEKKRHELTKRALGRMKRYNSREKLEAVNLKHAELGDKAESPKLVTERHFPTKDIVFLLALLVLAIVLWLLLR